MNNKKKWESSSPCPCHSSKRYCDCCELYHRGITPPPTALALMRSRYSAYALHLVDYIIQTTHPSNPSYTTNRTAWSQSILDFCQTISFVGLEILDFTEGDEKASITFTAHLQQNAIDRSFTEKSSFIKEKGLWLYKDGIILSTVHEE